jgi:putative ABC transport system permease protein
VIGVAARKGQSPTGQDYDDCVFIPYSTFAQKVQGGLGKYLQGTVYVQSAPNQTQRAQADITAVLRDRHHLARSDDDDFQIRNLSEIAGAQEEGTKTMTTLLASVAAVSLLVGGIGIMNIMLVSVTERTREIGIRMALGANRGDLVRLVVGEGMRVAAVGTAAGLAGVALLLAAVAFAASWIPARRATRVDPLTALRHD